MLMKNPQFCIISSQILLPVSNCNIFGYKDQCTWTLLGTVLSNGREWPLAKSCLNKLQSFNCSWCHQFC